jgi:branched-chain amino acid transport system ATP-binding protein
MAPDRSGLERQAMSDIVLATSGLSKRFGALAVANDIDLELAVGERRAIIGPNGAGKTTLVGLLSGILQPDRGTITLLGRDITGERPDRRVKSGLVRTFQVSSLFRNLTVLENVYLAVSEHAGASWRMWRAAVRHRDILERAEQVIVHLGLGDDRHRRISEIAYGRQRLVEIAIALSLEPKVLVLDEPAAGIPSDQAIRLLEVIEFLPSDMAIIMIEHDMQIVRRFAAIVTVLVAGTILMTGSPQEVMSAEEVRSVYLGHSGHARFTAASFGA